MQGGQPLSWYLLAVQLPQYCSISAAVAGPLGALLSCNRLAAVMCMAWYIGVTGCGHL